MVDLFSLIKDLVHLQGGLSTLPDLYATSRTPMKTPIQSAQAALRQLPVRELLAALEAFHPDTLPRDASTDPREFDRRVGEQRVLDTLRRVIREAERVLANPSR
jgi:hypothetical protein